MFLILLISFIVTFLLYYINLFSFWRRKNVKQAPVFLSAWETTLQTLKFRSFLDNDVKNYKRFAKSRYVGVYQFTRPLLMITDPELLIQLAIKDTDRLSDHQFFTPPGIDKFWDNNLFALQGQQWRNMRAILSPTYTSSKMRAMFELMNDTAQEFCAHFARNANNTRNAINMKEAYRRYATDIIANCAFGIKCDSLACPDNDFYINGLRTTNFSSFTLRMKMVISMIFPCLAKCTTKYIFDPYVSRFFLEKIQQQIKLRQENGIIRPDVIHLLLEARKGQLEMNVAAEDALSDIDMTAQALFFFSAAFDTVSSNLSFTSYELAVHPEIQQRLREEIMMTRSQYGDQLTYDALFGMKYMDMVISEGLRKWPPIVFTDRRASAPYTIHKHMAYTDEPNEVILNEGESVTIPIYAIHHDPDYYPDPDVFDPERFSAENRKHIKQHMYLPFGIGPRNCIGSRFAVMEIKVLFFHLLTHFEIVVDQRTQIPAQPAKSFFNLEPADGIWLRYNKLRK